MIPSFTRRQFLSLAIKAGALAGLSSAGLLKMETWAGGSGPAIVWLEGGGCSGCFVSLANYFDSTASRGFSELLTEIDLKYAPLLMSASGERAILQLMNIINSDYKHIILLVAGSIPSRSGFCTVGSFEGKEYDFKEMLVELTRKAISVVGIGSCAAYGGIASSRSKSGPRFAPMEHFIPATTNLILTPGCPPHPDWIVTVLIDIIAGQPIPLDRYKRPLSFFGQTVCSQCPRLPYKQAERFAQNMGTKKLCLKWVGCRGETSYCDTAVRGWNESDSWCLSVNSICIGCTEPFFPDAPFFRMNPGAP